MSPKLSRAFRTGCLVCILAALAVAQKGGQGANQASQQGGQGTPGGAGQGLPGLSYSPEEWPQLRLPDVKGPAWTFKEGRAVVCYRLAKGNSSMQPFILEPVPTKEIKGSGFYRPCGDDGRGETDSEGQRICRQEIRDANAEKKQQEKDDAKKGGGKRQAKNQTMLTEPTDPTHWSACSEQIEPILMNQVLVVGVDISDLGEMGVNVDQLKLLNINVTNQQGSPLNPSPIRASFPSSSSGGGGGGGAAGLGPAPEDTSGQGNWWKPLGARVPAGTFPQHWKPRTHYDKGNIVSNSTNHDFYTANNGFLSGPRPSDPFPPQPRADRVIDGDVTWQEASNPQAGFDKPPVLWRRHTSYKRGDIVCVPRSGTNDVIIGIQAAFQMTAEAVEMRPNPDADPRLLRVSSQSADAQQIGAADVAASPWSSENIPCQAAIVLQGVRSKVSVQPDPIATLRGSDDFPGRDAAINLLLQVQSDSEQLPTTVEGRRAAYERHEAATRLLEGDHLHYYWAVRGGLSGPPPPDPLSLHTIPRAIYLTWPYQLPGDVIPTFTVNMIYSPPAPGAPWKGNTFYPAGSVVAPTIANGHYYTALTGGFSSAEPDQPEFIANTPPNTPDGDLVWLDSGASAPSAAGGGGGGGGGTGGGGPGGQGTGGAGGKAQQWLPSTHYLLGDIVVDATSGHYYTMMQSTGGRSGQQPTSGGDPFSQIPGEASPITDGDLLWIETTSSATVPMAKEPKVFC